MEILTTETEVRRLIEEPVELAPVDVVEQALGVLSLSSEFEATAEEGNDDTEEAAPVEAVNPPPQFQRVTKEKEPEYPNNATRQIMKELKELSTESYSEDQLKVEMVEDNPFKLRVILTPNDGLYKDGYYEMDMNFTAGYPATKPTFHCPCEIFHPNIDYSGTICFSLLGASSADLRITDYAHGLLWLLYYPNLYSRMNMDCPREEKKFADMVRTSIVGGKVCNRDYKRSRCLPAEKKEDNGDNLKTERNGKQWVWKLVDEDWVQVFVDPSEEQDSSSDSSSSSSSSSSST